MKPVDLIREIVATYEKHRWRLRRVLLRAETRVEVDDLESDLADVAFLNSSVDALWFSRPSHNNREAWELRLLAEVPYALFETFALDDGEEIREAKRSELEGRLSDFASKR